MSNILKGILYTGATAVVGAVGYLVGKYKYGRGKISITMIGLALVLYAPRGCETLDTYFKTRAEVKKAQIYGVVKKDSLDSNLRMEESRDSTKTYVRDMLKNASETNQRLKDTYDNLLRNSGESYQDMWDKNESKYKILLNDAVKQTKALEDKVMRLGSDMESMPYKDVSAPDIPDVTKPVAPGIVSNGSSSESSNKDYADAAVKQATPSDKGYSEQERYEIAYGGRIVSQYPGDSGKYYVNKILSTGKSVVLVFRPSEDWLSRQHLISNKPVERRKR